VHSAASGPPGFDQVTIQRGETAAIRPRASRRRHCPRRDAAGHSPWLTRKLKITLGKPVQVRADGPLGDAAWAKQRLSRATQALPNGYCELPLVKTCPHANSCSTCPMFVTSAEFPPQHHAQRQQTLQIITAAEAAGQARVAEMNRQVAGNLEKIIASLEADDGEDTEETASAS